MLLSFGGADAKILYVNGAVAKSGNGVSWKKAYKYLRDALDESKQGDQIYLAKGTYYPDDGKSGKFGDRELAFELNGQKIYGGFAGTETRLNQRNPQVNPTSLSGAIWNGKSEDAYWSLHVVVLNKSSTLDGVTVENGHASGAGSWNFPHIQFYDEGGGCYVKAGQTLTLSSCVFRNNRALANGGAIMVEDDKGKVVATNCLFERNQIQLIYEVTPGFAEGGAIKGNVQATYCKFISNTVRSTNYLDGNTSTAFGGAISGNTTAVDCEFTGNSTLAFAEESLEPEAHGGAVYGELRAIRCLFKDNVAQAVDEIGISTGGAVSGASVAANSCYFTGNRSGTGKIEEDGPGSGGGGAIYASGGTSTLANCIFVNNNSGVRGGAIHAASDAISDSLTIANCTLLNNGVATGFNGAAISSNTVVKLLNSIIWFTNVSEGNYERGNLIHVLTDGALRNSDVNYPTPSAVAMNVMEGGASNITQAPGANVFLVSPSGTILTGNPMFVAETDPDGADNVWRTADDGLRLGAGSSAVGIQRDLGESIAENILPKDILDIDSDDDVSEYLPLDIIGVVRIQDSFVEMGAYEIGSLRQSPEIAVLAQNEAELRDGSSISFGAVGEFSASSRTYVIKNVGTGVLTGISFNIKGSTRIKLLKPSATSLSPGSSMKFTVSFIPNENGTTSAKLAIRSNDSDENPFNLNFSGTGGTGGKSRKPSHLLTAASPHLSLMQTTHEQGESAITTTTLPIGSQYLVLTVRKSANPGQPDPIVEVSSDLIDWHSGSKHTTTLLDTPTVLSVRDNTPIIQGEKRYIRLK